VFVLWLIPKWFDIHWSCVTGSGELGNTPGDSYSDTFAVLGTFGWIVVAIIALFARVAERPRLAAVIAAAWFGLLVGGALLSAAAIGPRTLSELIRRKRLRGRRDRAASAARLPAPEGDA
jgi:hypothetical protein